MRNFKALHSFSIFIAVATEACSLLTTVPKLFADLGHNKQVFIYSEHKTALSRKRKTPLLCKARKP